MYGAGCSRKKSVTKKSSKNILKPAKLWNREKSVILKLDKWTPRGFNGSVNIPESCDFQSQFDPLNITF